MGYELVMRDVIREEWRRDLAALRQRRDRRLTGRAP